MKIGKKFDVIIIGGSYAGLSAAMSLGRSLRQVLIIDSGKPCNAQTPHSHNFITQDGEKPAIIAKKAREQVLKYNTVSLVHDEAVAGKRDGNGYIIKTASETVFEADKLIFATGIYDRLPAIPGFSECWGISVVHCPYCHGYELKAKRTGIYANGDKAYHFAGLVNNLTNDLILLTGGPIKMTTEQRARINDHRISVVENEIVELVHDAGYLKEVKFKEGGSLQLDGLYASVPFEQHSSIPQMLGCELTDNGYIKVDPFQKTILPGVYACGDNCMMMRSVAAAVYSGNLAGAMVNKELTDDRF